MKIDPKIIYTPDYDIHFLGIEKLHPFDTRKFSRAYNLLNEQFGDQLKQRTIRPESEIIDDDLRIVHTAGYLASLKSASVVARALELPLLATVPYLVLNSRLLSPMRLGVQGTVIAAYEAMQNGLAINLAGGYHHASSAKGEGFCLYADIPLAIEKLRQDGLLQPHQQAIIIDLDAHQGNGYERVYHQDNRNFIFDVYNQMIYPMDAFARERIDYAIPLNSGCNGRLYMDLIRHKLPEALQRVKTPGIAFYIAGTDIYEGDLLGNLKVSEADVIARDQFVLNTLMAANIPTVMVLGGGYSKESYEMIAATVGYVLETWG
ncbi:MAG: histone deacetylase [Phototrophicales bacterium]